MNFANTRNYFAELLQVRNNTKIEGMTVDELAAYASYLHGNLPNVIDVSMSLMDASEVMAEKLAHPMRGSRLWLRLLCSATAVSLRDAIYKISPLVFSAQLLDLDRMCGALEYHRHIGNIGHSLTSANESDTREKLQRIADDMENDALWDEVTGRFKAPVDEQATS